MEKRTILAFVLSFLVLIIWSYVFGPKQEQAPKQIEVPEKESLKAESERPRTPALTPPAIVEVPDQTEEKSIPKAAEKQIKIDTQLYRAILSSAGPSIMSFKLKDYRETTDPGSPMIDLVNFEKGMGDTFLVGFGETSAARKKKIIYEVEEESIRLEAGSSPKDLVFRSVTPEGVAIHQTYRFYPDQYRIDLSVDLVNQSRETVTGSVAADLKALAPKEKKSYYSYVGLVLLLEDKLKEVKIKEASEEKLLSGQIDWMAYEDDFFISAVMPDQPAKATFKGSLSASGVLQGSYVPASISISPSEKVSTRFTLYFGPRDLGILKQLGKNLERAINFGWTDIIAKPLLYLLRFFNRYIHNYGVSIILLTILVKILFWPLTHKSYKSMKEMQKLQPRMAKMREKYKNDKAQLNKEMMGLYKTYKVNPMGGCLPMIIQIPVFFALFRILGTAIELRQAPFALWINDLSAPDRLFHFAFEIPFMSPPYGIPVLTLLMGASMFIQQKMTPTPGDPTQAKIMLFLPIIFTFMFINFPSGLVLYWLVNNLLSIGQQYRIHKRPA
jgi:YidC/Oxa1 family membrane protein insertase